MIALGPVWKRLAAGSCIFKRFRRTSPGQPAAVDFLQEVDPSGQIPNLVASRDRSNILKLGMH